MWTRTLLAPALALTLVAGSLLGQEEEAPAEAFFDVTHVEVVNVDVWVTDKSGRSVTGLGRDDFLVYRDGAPVEISNFYTMENGRETTPGFEELAADPRLERDPLSPVLADEHRLWLILYVDNFNLKPLHKKRVFPHLRQFLARTLRAADRAMVVSYARSLKVRQPFTENVDLLFAALDEMEDDTGHAVMRERERTDTLKLIANARDASQALNWARNYAESQMNDTTLTLRALQELIDSLAGLPGRKAIVYVTSGIPMAAGEEMFHAVAERFEPSLAYAEIPRHDTTRAFERVTRQATANRVVFYSMDASGMRANQFGAAEYGNFLTPGLRSTLESTVLANEQSSLRLLARETGGQAILNRNEILPALEEAAADFRTFYSLGILNPDTDDLGFHKIKVKVKQKGVRVRHRQGYWSREGDHRMADSLRSALYYDYQDNPLEVSVEWGRPVPEEDGKNFVVPIRLTVPVKNVVLLPTAGGRYEMRLRLFCGVIDEKGGVSEIQGIPLGLRLAEEHVEAAKKESYVYVHRLRMDKGRQKVALALLDQFGSRFSIVSRQVVAGN